MDFEVNIVQTPKGKQLFWNQVVINVIFSETGACSTISCGDLSASLFVRTHEDMSVVVLCMCVYTLSGYSKIAMKVMKPNI